MACGFRAGFLEEVAFEPALMDWVRQSCGQDSLSRRNSLGKGLEGMRTRWVPGEQRSTSVPPPDPQGLTRRPALAHSHFGPSLR